MRASANGENQETGLESVRMTEYSTGCTEIGFMIASLSCGDGQAQLTEGIKRPQAFAEASFVPKG